METCSVQCQRRDLALEACSSPDPCSTGCFRELSPQPIHLHVFVGEAGFSEVLWNEECAWPSGGRLKPWNFPSNWGVFVIPGASGITPEFMLKR